MRLTIIGCSGSMSGPGSSASSYLVQASGGDPLGPVGAEHTWSVILDLGPGSMGRLLNHVDPADLDAICISHCHADHMVDLVGMHVYRRWNPTGPLGPVLTLGPSNLLERLRGVDGTEKTDEDYRTEFDVRTVTPGRPVRVGPMTITPYTALHPVEAYGFRIEGPSEDGSRIVTMAFTGDTDSCEGMTAMAEGVDLLLSEAAFVEGGEAVRGMHLTGLRAGELAAEGRVGRLILTHIQPWTDPAIPLAEACRAYSGPVDAAMSSMVWEL